jgi:hypothetical protein
MSKFRETPGKGRVKARISRDSRRTVKEQEVTPRVGPALYEIKKPQIKEQKQNAVAVLTRDGHIRERGKSAPRC